MRVKKTLWLDGLKLIGITLGVYAFFKWILPLVIPFLIALLLAKWLHPLADRLHKKRKIPKGITSILSVLLALAVLGVSIWLIGSAIGLSFTRLWEDRQMLTQRCLGIWDRCCCQVEAWTGISADRVDGFVETNLHTYQSRLESWIMSLVMDWSAKGARILLTAAGVLIVVVIASYFMIKDYEKMKNAMQHNRWGKVFLKLGHNVLNTGGTYFKAQLIIMGIVAGICSVGLLLCGNRYAWAAGIGIGICDALPFIGTGTIFVPWALLLIFQGRYAMACACAGIFAATTLVRQVLEPRIMGKGMGVHPLVVMISIYAGLCVFGIWGVLFGPIGFILIREIYFLDISDNVN